MNTTNNQPKSNENLLFKKPKVFGSEKDRYERKVKAFWLMWASCFNGAKNNDLGKIMTSLNVGRSFYQTMRDMGFIRKGSKQGESASLYYSDFHKIPTKEDIDKCINEQSVRINKVFSAYKAKVAKVEKTEKSNEMDATLKELLAKAEEANKRVAELLSRYQSKA
jgi:predicted DNA-binding protein YlxM (UPF0122 family)